MAWPFCKLVTMMGKPVATLHMGNVHESEEEALRWMLYTHLGPIPPHQFQMALADTHLSDVDGRDAAYRNLDRWTCSSSSFLTGKERAVTAWLDDLAEKKGWIELLPGEEYKEHVYNTGVRPRGKVRGEPAAYVSMHTAQDFPLRFYLRIYASDLSTIRPGLERLHREYPRVEFRLDSSEGYWRVKAPLSGLDSVLSLLLDIGMDVIVGGNSGRQFQVTSARHKGEPGSSGWIQIPARDTADIDFFEPMEFWPHIAPTAGEYAHVRKSPHEVAPDRAGAIAYLEKVAPIFLAALHRLTGCDIAVNVDDAGNTIFGACLQGSVVTPSQVYPHHTRWKRIAAARLPLDDSDDLGQARMDVMVREAIRILDPRFLGQKDEEEAGSATARQISYATAIARKLGLDLPASRDFGEYSAFIAANAEAYNSAPRSRGGVPGQPKPANQGKKWTEEHLKLLDEMWFEGATIEAISEALLRAPGAVSTRIIDRRIVGNHADAIARGIPASSLYW